MAYAQVQVKPEEVFNLKYFYLCTTKGCGAVINPEYPVAEKKPSPKYCKDCQSKENRLAVEAEFNARLAQ